MQTRSRLRRVRSLVIIAAFASLLAGCGSSGGAQADRSTTTEAKAKVRATTTTLRPAAPEAAKGLPTREKDAPSGTWLSIRYLTKQSGFDNPPGFAEGRRYDINASCEGGTCDLTLNSVDGSFNLPDVEMEPTSVEPIELAATGDAWAGVYTDTYGCTAENKSDDIESTATLGLAPVRVEGKIIALVGEMTRSEELTDAGRAAGCTSHDLDPATFQVVMADDSAIDQPFKVDGRFFETLEVATSNNITNEKGRAGYVGYNIVSKASDFSGSCDSDDCTVRRVFNNRMPVELTRDNDARALTGSTKRPGRCVKDGTGEEVLQKGAYDSTAEYSLFPALVIDGEAKVLLGRVVETSIPTDLGRAQGPGICDQEQTQITYEYFVARDLYS